MIGAGTIINPIIKIVTTVAILAAVYFFIVKPALDTTENVSRDINHSINQSFRQTNKQVDDAFDDLNKNQQTQITKSIKGTNVKIDDAEIPAAAKAQQKILECVQRAAPDTAAMQACVN